MLDILAEYQKIVGQETINELRQLASLLVGKRILHINSTRYGGGVAEILSKMVHLTNALGIETRWETITGSEEFFKCTKNIHNSLQGKKGIIFSPQTIQIHEGTNEENSSTLRPHIENADVIFVHDPQPAPLIKFFRSRQNKWVWRCHIAVSNPHRHIWEHLRRSVSLYDASIFSLPDFVQPLPHPIYLIPPSIDPLSDKNIDLTEQEISDVYPKFGLDRNHPILLQVSRFDYFKDPLGVIEAYRLAKLFERNLQLVLAGGGAQDDPESASILEAVKKAAGEDPNIHVLYLEEGAHRVINALQRAAKIVIQKSTKEGFGLTVSEALWKHKPVIGGNTGGIRLQVANHHTGFLVNTPEGAALRIRYLLQNPTIIQSIGERGHRFVRDNFLLTRHLRDYLTVIISLLHPNEMRRIELQTCKGQADCEHS